MSRRSILSPLIWLAVAATSQADVYTSKEGGFRVNFPTPAEREIMTEPSPLGDIVVDTYMTTAGAARYAILVSEFPAARRPSKERYDNLRQKLLAEVGGRVVSESDGMHQGQYVCRDVRIDGARTAAGAGTAFARFIFVDNRGYQILASYTGAAVDETDYRRFRDSFQLIPASPRNKAASPRTLRPVDELFFVTFPGEPLMNQETRRTGVGDAVIRTYQYRVPDKKTTYEVEVRKAPNNLSMRDPKVVLDKIKAEMLRTATRAQGVREHAVEGWPAVDAKLRVEDGTWATQRFIIIDSNLHTFSIVSDESALDSPAHVAFFDSILLAVKKDLKPSAGEMGGGSADRGASRRGQPETFTPKAGGYSVAMPGKAEERTERLKYKGETLPQAVAEVGDAPGGFRAGVFEIPATFRNPDPSEALNEARDAMVARVGGKVLIERKSQVLRSPAREMKVETSDGLVLTARLIFNRRRVYEISAARPKANPEADAVTAFLNSFKLTGR